MPIQYRSSSLMNADAAKLNFRAHECKVSNLDEIELFSEVEKTLCSHRLMHVFYKSMVQRSMDDCI